MNEQLTLRDSEICLPDGRTLAYAEYGEAGGWPLLFFHGTPGARLLHPRAVRAGAAGSRIISVERPGYGRSDFHTGWGMLEWADDVAALADALGLVRFAVVAPSGGGPYATACAYRLPARVTAVGLLSSPAPFPADRAGPDASPADHTGMSETTVAARTLSWPEFRNRFEQVKSSTPPDSEQFFASLESLLPECDRQVLALPEVRESFRLGLGETFRQGLDGWAWDAWLLARPWGFRVEDITVPAYVWHGKQDRIIPPAAGRYFANAIPNCRAVFFPDEGHLLSPSCWDEILSTLAAGSNVVV
jgi:pimeloyl-ACP methyl ester carboxylesterase